MGNIVRAVAFYMYHEICQTLHMPRPKAKRTPLMWPHAKQPSGEQIQFALEAVGAAQRGDLKNLQELNRDSVRRGYIPLPEVVDRDGSSLMHVAMAKSKRVHIIKYLLNCGCSLTKGNSSKETPLHTAAMKGNVDGLKFVRDVQNDLDDDLDLEVKDMWGRTPLLKAMVYNHENCVNFFLDAGANVNAQDVDGVSMLHLAVTYKKLTLLHRLVKKGAHLNSLNYKKRPPLFVAASMCDTDLVQQLLELGASTEGDRSHQSIIIQTIGRVMHAHENGGHVEISATELVLHLLLSAHGFPLHSEEPNVFCRVFKDEPRLLPLVHKMHVCSDCPHENNFFQQVPQTTRRNSDILRRTNRGRNNPRRNQNLGSSQGKDETPRTPVTLFNLARRASRKGLMGSGRNVLWAVDHLRGVPPAVKGILLLKDCEIKEPPALLKLSV